MIEIIESVPHKASPLQRVALDFEMFGQTKLHRPTGTFATLSVCFEGEDQVYQVYTEDDLVRTLKELCQGEWVMHNATYDMRQARRYLPGIWPARIWDTMLVERIMWSGLYDSFSLADLSRRYLSLKMEKAVREEFFGGDLIMTSEMKQYAALDAWATMRIAALQQTQISPSDLDVYRKIDEPAIEVVLSLQPVRLDVDGWIALADSFQPKADAIEEELGINVYSPPQVKAFLAKRGFKVDSTGKEVLDTLPETADGVIEKIKLARTYRKAVSTYGRSFIDAHIEEGDLLYSDFGVTNASTGRMSSSEPALQNIPSRTIPEYRDTFISRRGKLIVMDISQQEPRILAYHSKDPALVDCFVRGEDVHLYVARLICDDPDMDVHDPRRKSIGKPINLGTSYGLTAKGLAERTGQTVEEAQALLDKYFKRFAGVEYYITKMRSEAEYNGYVMTAAGRKSWVNPYNHQWKNNAINAPIQGGGADFTKRWGRIIFDRCRELEIEFPITMFIHDEIVADVPEQEVTLVSQIMQDAMVQAAAELYPGIPFTGDLGVGDSWGSAKP